MRSRRAIVHAGLEKTGTTTIQDFLSLNRNALALQGFWVPTTLGTDSHVKLCGLAQSAPPKFPTMWNILGITDQASHRRFVETTASDFHQEIEALDPSIHTVLFSNEHLHSNLITAEEITNLRRVLEPYFSSISILFYLRRQDKIASSLFSTRIKGGETIDQPVFVDLNAKYLPYYYDYYRILKNYEAVFGRPGLTVRKLEPDSLVGHDLLQDYCDCTGIVMGSDVAPVARKNEALEFKALYLLSLLNPHIPPFIEGRWNPDRNWLVEILEKFYRGNRSTLR